VKSVAVLPGDGIGPEVVSAVLPVLERMGLPLEFRFGEVGRANWCREGDPVPEATWNLLAETDTCLLGAVTSKPVREAEAELADHLRGTGLRYVSPVVQLRQRLMLYANVRPVVDIAFVLGCLGVTAAWSVGGLYLGLGGSLAKELLHIHNHLVAGLVILTVQGIGGFSQLVLTRISARTASVVGCLALMAGMAVVAVSIRSDIAALFLVGDAITGVGFGLAFMGGTRLVNQASPPERRGQVLAAYFVVANLAISVPAIGAGVVSTRIGLSATFYGFAVVMGVVSLITLVRTLGARTAGEAGRK
jgi:hypothetical protein